MKQDLLNNLAMITDKKQVYVTIFANNYPRKQIKQLLKTFKKKDEWQSYITNEGVLVITWQSGIANGSMRFYKNTIYSKKG